MAAGASRSVAAKPMSYVFVSHASEDKQERVRPIVEALLLHGLTLWIDRPGHGECHFNFDDAFIERHRIRGLRTGEPWPDQINRALADAGVVLVCLSRSLCARRQVLVQELLLASTSNKLVACVVDDVPWSEIPSDLGLTNPSRIQAERIDPHLLKQAVERIRLEGMDHERLLPPPLRHQWEIVRRLVREVHEVFDRAGLLAARPEDLAEAQAAILRVPIGPMVHARQIPNEVIAVFADHFEDPRKARRFLELAMQIRRACNPEGFTEAQVLVRPAEVPSPNSLPAEAYWADVLTLAGHKSRRTLASLFKAPGAPSGANTSPASWPAVEGFYKWLEGPST